MPKLPVISGKDLIRALKQAGFVEVRQKVSTTKIFKTVVPLHKELAKGT